VLQRKKRIERGQYWRREGRGTLSQWGRDDGIHGGPTSGSKEEEDQIACITTLSTRNFGAKAFMSKKKLINTTAD
jgi:hypothetical protein